MNDKFNESAFYEQEILPIVTELFKKLKSHNIPAYFSACIANGEKGSKYKTELISADIAERRLTDDRFLKFVDINLGFDTVPNKLMEIEYEAK